MYLAAQDFDLKTVARLIATSQAWQSRTEAADQGHSAGYYLRRAPRMTAEQFVDTLWQITGSPPEIYDASVLRGETDATTTTSLDLTGYWISVAADPGSRGDGQSVAFRTSFTLKDAVLRGAAVIACDAPFQFYVNSHLVLRGNRDHELFSRELQSDLPMQNLNFPDRPKESFVIVVLPTAAVTRIPQLYFEARLKLKNGAKPHIASDDGWPGMWGNLSLREGRIPDVPDDMPMVSIIGSQSTNAADIREWLAASVSDRMPMARTWWSACTLRSIGRWRD